MKNHLKLLTLIVLLFVPACAMKHQTLGPTSQAPVLTDTSFIAADGYQHALTTWAPAGEPWAVIVALHGFNDYRMAFKMPGEYFAGQGIAVMAFDQRGFGENYKAGFWAKKDALRSDALAMLALARNKYPGLPIYLMGESMGGAVALYSLTGSGAASGLILVAPGVWGWRPVNIIYKPVLWTISHLMPGQKFSGRSLKIKSSDNIDMLIAMSDDPWIIRKTRIDAVFGLARIARAGMKASPGIKVPTLLIYGENDDVVPAKISQKLWGKLPDTIKTQIIYPEGHHLLLRDCQAQTVWNDILRFLEDGAGRTLNLPSPVTLCQPSSSSE